MSNARINSLNGKPVNTTNNKTFGHTISDKQTDPNVIQTTFMPGTVDGESVTTQQFEFLLGNSIKTSDAGITPAIMASETILNLVPDLTLATHKHYQLHAKITLILRPIDDTAYKCGFWVITGAARDTTLLGDNGYVLTQITSDNGIDAYVPNTAITLSIVSNKFKILVAPIDNIIYSADLFVDVTIIASSYSFTP